MSREVADTPTSAWISRASRSSRKDWSTLRPNQARTLNNWAVLASPFLNLSSKLLIAISVLGRKGGDRRLTARNRVGGGGNSRSRSPVCGFATLQRNSTDSVQPGEVDPGRPAGS